MLSLIKFDILIMIIFPFFHSLSQCLNIEIIYALGWKMKATLIVVNWILLMNG